MVTQPVRSTGAVCHSEECVLRVCISNDVYALPALYEACSSLICVASGKINALCVRTAGDNRTMLLSVVQYSTSVVHTVCSNLRLNTPTESPSQVGRRPGLFRFAACPPGPADLPHLASTSTGTCLHLGSPSVSRLADVAPVLAPSCSVLGFSVWKMTQSGTEILRCSADRLRATPNAT